MTSSSLDPTADALLQVEQLLADGDDARALALLSAAIERDAQPELLVLRARLTMGAALDAPGEDIREQIEWLAGPAGQQSVAIGLERALADVDAALARRDDVEWRLLRADMLLDGGRWEEAEAEFGTVRARVETLPPDERELARERVEIGIDLARQGPEGGGELLEALDVLAQFGEPAEPAPDAVREHARSIAWTLAQRHADVPERYAPFDADELDPAARAFYDSALAALERLGYELCADLEPLHNTEQSGTRTLLRVVLSPDRLTAAAIWRLAGPHSCYEVTELESVLADGTVVQTNNQGTANPFEQPPQINGLSLPPGTDAATLVEAHTARVAGSPSPAVALPGLDAVIAAQERQRVLKREFARSRGWVSEAELRGLLGASYDELAGPVREELAALLEGFTGPFA